MIELLKAFGLIAIVAIFVYWIYSLVTWDGSDCDGNDCDQCPFDCDKRKKP